MDKKEEELKKKLEEDLKRRLESDDFNNSKEDKEIIKETKEEDFFDEKDKKKNVTIIVLVAVVVLLLIIVLFFLLSGGKKDSNGGNSNDSNNQNESGENNNDNNDDGDSDISKLIKEEDYDYSKGSVYLNKYVYVPAKTGNKKVITDLEGIILYSSKESYFKVQESGNYIYIIHLKSDGNYVIKSIKDSKASDVFSGKAAGLLKEINTDKIVGLYKDEGNKTTIYLLNGTNYDTYEIDGIVPSLYGLAEGEDKYIYNGKYIITAASSKNGLYDIKNKKQIISNTYDKIEFLHDDIFVAVKDNKAGVINKDNKVLLEFNYDFVTYSNKLYFIGDGNKLYVYDNNFKNLNIDLNVSSLKDFTYHPCCGDSNPFRLMEFKSNVVVEIGFQHQESKEYVVIDKNNNVVNLGYGRAKVIDNYLFKSSEDDNLVVVYDEALKPKCSIDVGEKNIDLERAYIYLNTTLVINNNRLYNLADGTSKGNAKQFRRISQEYDIKINSSSEYGKVIVSSNEEVLKELDNVSVEEFLKAKNNGVTVTKEYFIYNAGGVVILKRTQPATNDLE